MCEVTEYLESDELVVFGCDPKPSYTDGVESEDSKSDFPEAECALALLELARSFVLVSSLGSFDQIGNVSAPSNTTLEAFDVQFCNHLKDHATSGKVPQHTTVLDESQTDRESDFWTTQSCCHRNSVYDLLSIVKLDHSYETRCSHMTGNIRSGNKVPKKAKDATLFGKFRKIRKQTKNRKAKVRLQNFLLEDKQTKTSGSSSSSHSDRDNQAAVSHVKSQSHHLLVTDAFKEMPLEKPANHVSFPTAAEAMFSSQGKRKLSTS